MCVLPMNINLNNTFFIYLFYLLKEPMDTSESLKPETPQPTTKENSQKEQNDNSVAGMFGFFECIFSSFVLIVFFFFYF